MDAAGQRERAAALDDSYLFIQARPARQDVTGARIVVVSSAGAAGPCRATSPKRTTICSTRSKAGGARGLLSIRGLRVRGPAPRASTRGNRSPTCRHAQARGGAPRPSSWPGRPGLFAHPPRRRRARRHAGIDGGRAGLLADALAMAQRPQRHLSGDPLQTRQVCSRHPSRGTALRWSTCGRSPGPCGRHGYLLDRTRACTRVARFVRLLRHRPDGLPTPRGPRRCSDGVPPAVSTPARVGSPRRRADRRVSSPWAGRLVPDRQGGRDVRARLHGGRAVQRRKRLRTALEAPGGRGPRGTVRHFRPRGARSSSNSMDLQRRGTSCAQLDSSSRATV